MNMDVYLTMWGPSEFTITGTLKDVDLLPELAKIKQPVLLTCGDNDEAGVKTVKDYQIAFPNASMAVLPDSSHLHHLERPHLYLRIVRDFLKK
jgi:proline iminopeptidase